ncbi:probable G-protein coupled receptor 139 [Chiloscyllium punctatum]|uniref:probable G-protein coupled receptor 139 n=1 Tax=Chiloscyllium punctatum TaxID=137246 RepID=UPI003B63CDB0
MRRAIILQIQEIYYPVLAALGIPVNLVAIIILSQGNCGLSNCISYYMIAMAAADLMVVIFDVIFTQINNLLFPYCFLDITVVCSLKSVLLYISTDSSLWLTVAFTLDRFVAISCQKLRLRYCTGKTAVIVISAVCTLFCIKNIPVYFIYTSIDTYNNVEWFCAVRQAFNLDLGWRVFEWLDSILTPCLPLLLILLLNVLTIRHILVAGKVRRRFRGGPNNNKHADPEMESRRKSIVLLLTVSGTFLLLWMTFVLNFLIYRFTVADLPDGFNSPASIFTEVGFMLQLLSCCTNTFIYTLTQTKFREQLKNMVRYPWTQIVKCLK